MQFGVRTTEMTPNQRKKKQKKKKESDFADIEIVLYFALCRARVDLFEHKIIAGSFCACLLLFCFFSRVEFIFFWDILRRDYHKDMQFVCVIVSSSRVQG